MMKVSLYFGDYNRGVVKDGLLYSPIYDRLGDILTNNGYSVSVLERELRPIVSAPKHRKGKSAPLLVSVMIKACFKGMSVINRLPFRANFNLINPFLLLFEIYRVRSEAPSLIIGVNPTKELCLACSLLKVPIYDFQHGRPDLGNKYYPAVALLPESQKPSGFFAWDDWSKNTMDNYGLGRPVEVVGYPLPMISDVRCVGSTVKTRLLICLGWGMTKSWDGITVGLPDWFLEHVDALVQHYEITVRAHPMSIRRNGEPEVKAAISKAFGSAVTIDTAQERDIIEALLLADVTLTRFSATSLEGGIVGVPNIFVNDECDEIPSEALGASVCNANALDLKLQTFKPLSTVGGHVAKDVDISKILRCIKI